MSLSDCRQDRWETHLAVLRPIFERAGPLSDSAWEAMVPELVFRSFRPKEPVFEAGQVVRDLNFVVSGLARYYYLDADGDEANKSFCDKGHILTSSTSLFSGQPSPFHVQALTEVECLSISYSRFVELGSRWPEWNVVHIFFLKQLVLMKERREAEFLTLSATERYQRFLANFADLVSHIPNYQIASYIGVTEVGLSRIRRRLGLTQVNDKQ